MTIGLIILIFSGTYIWTALGLLFCVYIFTNFVEKTGKIIPIKELLILIASLQWILGPYIDYSNGMTHHKYYMYIPQEAYMSYIVPAILLFWFGLNFLNRIAHWMTNKQKLKYF